MWEMTNFATYQVRGQPFTASSDRDRNRVSALRQYFRGSASAGFSLGKASGSQSSELIVFFHSLQIKKFSVYRPQAQNRRQ